MFKHSELSELAKKEELFDNIFSHANSGLAIVALDGKWLKINQSIVDLLGYSEWELYDMRSQDITHKDDLDVDLDHMNQLIDGEIKNYQIEKRYFHKGGHVVWVHICVSMVYDELDSPQYFILQIFDITQQKESSWQLNLLTNIIKNNNRKLKDFAHIATHDIRTHVGNLNSIIGFIEEEYKDIKGDENFMMLKESILNLDETLSHLNHIRQESLETNVGPLKALSLYKYVTKAIYNVNALAKNHNCKILNLVKTDSNVYAIEAYLDSIILNFLTNAIKYRSKEREPLVMISSREEDGFVILEIKDNGLGIDLEKNGHKLFTLNGTFHNHADSRGIGLFITKNHVESIGGKIAVESNVNKGTKFSIYFQKA